jgi:hypothetical protein
VAPARVRRTVDLGRVEDCLKLLSMRASFNASLAHPAHPCDARRVHVRIRKYGSSLAARWCVYRNKGLNVRGGTLGGFAASAAATVGFALQGERLRSIRRSASRLMFGAPIGPAWSRLDDNSDGRLLLRVKRDC